MTGSARRVRLAGWEFCPGRASTAVTLLLLPLLLALGFWQLDRARQKAELQALYAERFQRFPVALAEIDPAAAANRYRRVVVAGRYDGARQFLLDNQIHESRPGYHVLTALRLADGAAILVNRGWLSLGASRLQLPDVALSSEPVTVAGRLAQPANPGLRMGDGAGGDARWPRVIPYVDYRRLSDLLGYPLLPAIVLLEPEAPAGYRRDWQPRFGGQGPERHRGYAVQWFSLALALVVLYLAVNSRRLPDPT